MYFYSQLLWHQRERWLTNSRAAVLRILILKMRTHWFEEVNDLRQVTWPAAGATRNRVQISSVPGPLVVALHAMPCCPAVTAFCPGCRSFMFFTLACPLGEGEVFIITVMGTIYLVLSMCWASRFTAQSLKETLQMKLRLREAMWLVQGHTTSKRRAAGPPITGFHSKSFHYNIEMS